MSESTSYLFIYFKHNKNKTGVFFSSVVFTQIKEKLKLRKSGAENSTLKF